MATPSETPVCRIDDLADGEMKQVKVGEHDVLLARTDGQFYALHPQCTHYHAPLVKGILYGHRLVCPWHNACFDIRTGHRLEAPALTALPTYKVRIDGEQVFVTVTTDEDTVENPMAAPDSNNAETFVIVGSGGAGEFAAEAMREGGFTGKIVMLTASTETPYDRPNCSKDYLQGEAPDEWMPLRAAEFYQEYGIEIRTGQRVVSLDAATKTIELESGETLTYTKALVATGGKPNELPTPGVDLPGVHSLRSLHDSKKLRELGEQHKKIVIIGSSFIGMEGAMSLRKLGSEIDVVGTETVPFEKILGGKIGRTVQSWHEKAGIRFHLGRKMKAIEGDGIVQRVVLDNGHTIDADVVLLGVGVKPRTDFLKGVQIADDGGVLTDEYLQIADGLYAAGDIARYPTPDGAQRIEHWKVAGQQGYVAGLNMAKEDKQAYQNVPFFWTNQQGTRINYIGHADKFDDVIYDGNPETDESFLAFYVQKNAIKAIAGVKRDQDIARLRELMQSGKTPSVAEVRAGMK
ncbi:MAG: FAD-dependent oxidoreductase [Spirosoma sp.]|nr:FAD-dependent oxidoreductase [Spirosoma sp.]